MRWVNFINIIVKPNVKTKHCVLYFLYIYEKAQV